MMADGKTLALVGLAFGIGYALANIHRRTPPMSLFELLFGGEDIAAEAELMEVARIGLFYMREALATCGNNHEAAEAVEADIRRAERVVPVIGDDT